jgi:hypothetical protein
MITYRISPVLFIPGATAGVLAIYTYIYIMYKAFKERKLKKLTVLATVLASIFIVPYTAYAITTPRWSFTVSTDKTVYKLGENVTITATLTNNGYITHSFTSSYKDPILIGFNYEKHWFGVVFISNMQRNKTEFSIAPGQSIQRTMVWNQTILKWPTRKLVPLTTLGDYYIRAEIVDADGHTLFGSWTNITIEE